MGLRTFQADLHVHSALSPCASDDMTPPAIAQAAVERGLDLIAICDHNSCENVTAMVSAGESRGLVVLPGMEAESKEEVHVVCLFPGVDEALAWQRIAYSALPDAANSEEHFGAQLVMDSAGRVVKKVSRLLSCSLAMTFEDITVCVSELGGICIASHIDRPAYSLGRQLGFVPEGAKLLAVELSPGADAGALPPYASFAAGLRMVRSSDAHYLADIGKVRTELTMEALCFAELVLALKGIGGRSCDPGPRAKRYG